MTTITTCLRKIRYWIWSEMPSGISEVSMNHHHWKSQSSFSTSIRIMMENCQNKNFKKHFSGPVKVSIELFWTTFLI
jgi:hypothetical protein